MFFDPMYFLFLLPALVLSLFFSARVKSTFAKYSKVRAASGYTGAQAALKMLERSGVTNVSVRMIDGVLTDNYNPMTRVLSLSSEVYNGTSLAALGVACHEAGHALQHAEGYRWLGLRTILVPVVSFGSQLPVYIILLGALFNSMNLIWIGIILFSAVVLFSLVTLPVEWDASARAKKRLVACGLLAPSEVQGAGKVLNAAFGTYVAAAISALMTLLYYLVRFAGVGSRRD